MLPSTAQRVYENTRDEYNERIARETEFRVAECAAGGREAIDRRLEELAHEWDIERTLEANAATLALTGAVLGLFGFRKTLILPVMVTGFLLQHALQGWCPPLPLFRRLGIRTASEIDEERYALKALRGDFRGIAEGESAGGVVGVATRALDAARR